MPPALSEETVFIEAIGVQESGGNYRVVNSSSGALGKYQVLPSNLAPWLRECGLGVVSAKAYLNNPTLQDELARCKLGGDYNRYGPAGAAAVWYSGQPNHHVTYGNPPVYQNVNSVLAIMKRISGGIIPITSPVDRTMGPVHEANWSGHINMAVTGINQHHVQMHGFNAGTWKLLTSHGKLNFPKVR